MLAAAGFLDLLWPLFLLLGIEHVRIDPGNTAFTPLAFDDYPYSHSLLTTLVWSVLFGVGYHLLRHDKRGAVVLGAAVSSHWILDAVSHRPDLPLFPGSSTTVGLGLWNSVPATVIVEMALFAAGIIMYTRATRPKDQMGSIAYWTFIAFLLLTYAANTRGTPPPNERILAWFSLLGWLPVIWGAWIDRHREPRLARSGPL